MNSTEFHSIAKTDVAEHSHSFRQNVLWLVEFFASQGFEAKPWISSDLPLFSSLPYERREQILRELQDWTEVLRSCRSDFPLKIAHASQDSVEIDRPYQNEIQIENRILWRVLNDFGLKFPSDLFRRLPPDSVVEVYTADSRQVYRSMNFLKVCTYSLEEVYCWPWYELYERDEAFTRQSLGFLNRALMGTLRGIVKEPLESHWVSECKPGHSRRTCIQPTMLCFFEDDVGALSGYLYAFRVV